jgi:YidC/Oxa1 family membrane protein insertase
MDKQTTLGFILIGLVLIVWMWMQAPPPAPTQPLAADSLHTAERRVKDSAKSIPIAGPAPSSTAPTSPDSLGKYFAHLATGIEKTLIVKTDRYTAEITTKGGLLKKWELHNYNTWDGYPVQLVDMDRGGDLSILFTSSDGKLINTRNLYFESLFPNWKTVELHNDETFAADLVLRVSPEKSIVKHFTFTNGKYDFETELRFLNMGDVVSNFEYQVSWENGLRYAEHNSVDESGFAMAYAYSGGELTEIDAKQAGEVVKRDITGSTAWVATRNKYFALALVPEEGKSEGAYLAGTHDAMPDHGVKENYNLALKIPFRGGSSEITKVGVFLGPLEFNVIKSYARGLDQIMSLGAAWVIRPISEYVMIPLFQFLHLFIPNWGVVIIVVSIIIKLALHPLMKTSMKSAKKMQALQPLMTELKEKYKDDPQKMNQQTMNLYKEYGVNPAAGCLPLILQMPILYAMWSVFRSAIELRQASFIWWIRDLSIPDVVTKLPFAIPFFGLTELSGLALAMGVTMFIQQKMSITDPRQKAMVWMMPILMTLMFTGFPSGLNLYYFMFNLLSIGQQYWINKQHGNEPLRKVDPKKRSGGILGRITKDLPQLKK